MTTTYYTASSVDGFLADPDHSLSWLLRRDVDPAGPMGYDAFLTGVGALVMGASTFRWLVEHEYAGDPTSRPWLYEQPTWVFSSRDLVVPQGDVRVVSGDVAVHAADLATAAGGRDVWVVGGGDLAGQFADAGLLDEVWVQYAPVALGAGAPLLPRRLELRLLEVARNRDLACARFGVVG